MVILRALLGIVAGLALLGFATFFISLAVLFAKDAWR